MNGGLMRAYQDVCLNEVYVGLDVGQRVDHSAIAVVEKCETHSRFDAPVFECMRVQYLERLPLGTPYAEVVERVCDIVRHPKLGWKKKVVADATGVGGAVVEMLRRAQVGCPLQEVTLTGGARETGGGVRWNVPKQAVMNAALVLLEQGQLKVASGLKEAGTLLEELERVQVRQKASGAVQIGAEGAGEHDDLVMAVALGCWGARKKKSMWGTQRLL